jgi:dihydropyrimidine dehydrogenase (NAD+) subunit PreT
VLTGIFGRFIYGLVPSQGGKEVELKELSDRWQRLKQRIEPVIESARKPERLRKVFATAATPARRGSLLGYPFRVPWGALRARFRVLLVRRYFADRDDYAEFREGYVGLQRIKMQIAFYQSLKNLLRVWRLFHATLAGFLVVTIAAHIAVSLYFGYGWRR